MRLVLILFLMVIGWRDYSERSRITQPILSVTLHSIPAPQVQLISPNPVTSRAVNPIRLDSPRNVVAKEPEGPIAWFVDDQESDQPTMRYEIKLTVQAKHDFSPFRLLIDGDGPMVVISPPIGDACSVPGVVGMPIYSHRSVPEMNRFIFDVRSPPVTPATPIVCRFYSLQPLKIKQVTLER